MSLCRSIERLLRSRTFAVMLLSIIVSTFSTDGYLSRSTVTLAMCDVSLDSSVSARPVLSIDDTHHPARSESRQFDSLPSRTAMPSHAIEHATVSRVSNPSLVASDDRQLVTHDQAQWKQSLGRHVLLRVRTRSIVRISLLRSAHHRQDRMRCVSWKETQCHMAVGVSKRGERRSDPSVFSACSSCVRMKPSPFCLRSTVETTTERWMQKRGFPAAGILALLVLVTVLLIIAVKFITRHLDTVARRKNGSIRRSITTITTYRSRQPSPSAAISLSNTPCLPLVPMRTNTTTTTNAMVDLLNRRSQEYVVDIHRHADEDELSVFLLEKTPQIELESKDMIHIDDDDDNNNKTNHP